MGIFNGPDGTAYNTQHVWRVSGIYQEGDKWKFRVDFIHGSWEIFAYETEHDAIVMWRLLTATVAKG